MVIKRDDPNLLSTLVKILSDNGIGILPCDTIYGIVGIAPATELKIRSVKARFESKPFLILIPTHDWLNNFTRQNIPRELGSFWPGPLTLIFKHKTRRGKIALRVPEDDFLLRLLHTLGRPLYSTSVNISGQDFLCRIEDIKRDFKERVDIIVDAGDLTDMVPSTIVDVTTKPFTLVRQGKLHLPERFFL
ncbi:MAG: threonylcarbamoyl-AMP synthase [Spirochaetales bacterium]|nr:threonylcarbamoyl-AMP synthase [Spirochaetales bacterium]